MPADRPAPGIIRSSSTAAGWPRGAIRSPTWPTLPATARRRYPGRSYATLDNLVVGFRPTADTPSPVMPLAIRAEGLGVGAESGQQRQRDPRNALAASGGPPADDRSFRRSPMPPCCSTADRRPTALAAQVTCGVFPGDLPYSGGVLGPATPARPFPVAGSQVADAGDPLTATLQAALQQVVGRKRAFPLYRTDRQFRSAGTSGAGQTGTAQTGTAKLARHKLARCRSTASWRAWCWGRAWSITAWWFASSRAISSITRCGQFRPSAV